MQRRVARLCSGLLWPRARQALLDNLATVRMGDVADFGNFMGALIDRKAYERVMRYIDRAPAQGSTVLAGGRGDDRVGYFVQPTVIEAADPKAATMQEEIFGPVLSVHVYPDAGWNDVLALVDQTSPYSLTGAVFANDRQAIGQAAAALRFAAGNFYVNDKPTGAVVGQQPFGGTRRSGTNDKAGSMLNLQRWVSPRTVKGNLGAGPPLRLPVHGRCSLKTAASHGGASRATSSVLLK